MKIKEAKAIVGEILDWQFVMMGVKERKDFTPKIDLKKYSLQDLITATKLVKSNNKRKERLQKYHREKEHKTNGITVSIILDDRIIAAVYTALNFTPNGEAVALVNDIVVGCVIAKYDDETTES